MLEWIRRVVLCRLLNLHTGHIESAIIEPSGEEGGNDQLVLTYMPCVRCGQPHPLDLRKLHEVQEYLGMEVDDA